MGCPVRRVEPALRSPLILLALTCSSLLDSVWCRSIPPAKARCSPVGSTGRKGKTTLYCFAPREGAAYDPTDPNSPFSYQFFNASQQAVRISVRDTGVTQTANPVTVTVPQGPVGLLDHVKFLQFNKRVFSPAPSKKLLIFSETISAHISGGRQQPFPRRFVRKWKDDLRLGTCTLTLGDFSKGLIADFFLTNKSVFAYYERLPFTRTPNNTFRAFGQAKRVHRRASPDELVTLSVIYDKDANSLSWAVNSRVVLSVPRPGVPLPPSPGLVTLIDKGGADEVVQPASFSFGWGCFTLLDGVDYWKPRAGVGLVQLDSTPYATPRAFFDRASLESNRIWPGLGLSMTLKEFSVLASNRF